MPPAWATCCLQVHSEAALTLLRHTLATLEDLDNDPEYWTAKLRQTQEQQMLLLAKRAAGLVDLLARSGVLSNYTQEEGQGWLGSNLKQAISAAIIMNWVTAPHCHCIRPVAVPDFLKRDLPRKTADAQALKDWLSDLYDYTTLMDPHAMLDFDYDEDGNALPPCAEATFLSVTLPRHDFPLQPQQMACLHPALTPDLTAPMLHGLYSVLPEPHQDEERPGKDAQCLCHCACCLACCACGTFKTAVHRRPTLPGMGPGVATKQLSCVFVLAGEMLPAFMLALLPQFLFLLWYLRPQLKARGADNTNADAAEAYVQARLLRRAMQHVVSLAGVQAANSLAAVPCRCSSGLCGACALAWCPLPFWSTSGPSWLVSHLCLPSP